MLLAESWTEQVIGPAIEVHRNTGPGLLEAVYEKGLSPHHIREDQWAKIYLQPY
jgi:hypothetical protein